jgi:hypothetical protein
MIDFALFGRLATFLKCEIKMPKNEMWPEQGTKKNIKTRQNNQKSLRTIDYRDKMTNNRCRPTEGTKSAVSHFCPESHTQ